MATFRGSTRALQQQISVTAPKQQLRRLHITGSVATPSKLLTTDPMGTQQAKGVESPPITRPFNTTRSLKTPNDTSTIDFAYMPQFALDANPYPEISRIPLLPNNYEPPRRSVAHQEAMEPVIRPQIVTASADGTHVVSAMSEVTDNHAMEIDVFSLTQTVGKSAMGKVEEVVAKGTEAGGVVKELWEGLLDDLLGKKAVKA